MPNPASMTDSQLIMRIRQIENSPTRHLTAKLSKQRTYYLRELRAEARRRGLRA